MNLGFTGTREGMTKAQRAAVARIGKELLSLPNPAPPYSHRTHHGDCVGADSEFHDDVAYPLSLVILHRGPDGPYAANRGGYEYRPRKPYLERDRDIVEESDVLIAAPKGPEERRSGTWYTVRYARKRGRSIILVWPDGTETREP